MDLRLAPESAWRVWNGVTPPTPRVRDGVRPPQPAIPLLMDRGVPILPASSLKGVLRATAERILRAVDPDRSLDLPPLADIPFTHKRDELKPIEHRGQIADSELNPWLEDRGGDPFAGAQIYAQLSAASQLFGATPHAGLIALDDAHPASNAIEERPHVALDRFTGGAAHGALFHDELAPAGGELVTTLTITNFALWQIGLLGLVFQEINRGYATIGGGSRKGQGRVQIEATRITFRYPKKVYGDRAGGVISAQGQQPDAPEAVVKEEASRALLAGSEASKKQEPADWRGDGFICVVIDQPNVSDLFREAVRDAWVPWLNRVKQGGGDGHAPQPV